MLTYSHVLTKKNQKNPDDGSDVVVDVHAVYQYPTLIDLGLLTQDNDYHDVVVDSVWPGKCCASSRNSYVLTQNGDRKRCCC